MALQIVQLLGSQHGALTVVGVGERKRFGVYSDLELRVRCQCQRTFKVSCATFRQGLYESCAACAFVESPRGAASH